MNTPTAEWLLAQRGKNLAMRIGLALATQTRHHEPSERQREHPSETGLAARLTYGNRHAQGQRTKYRTALKKHAGFRP